MSVPPDGNPTVTRTRAARTAAVCAAACLVVLALLGIGVRTAFGPQLRLDAAVTDALYAGDDRSAALDLFLEVLTAPGSSWFRFVVFLPVVVVLLRRRAWWTAAWVVVAVVGIGPLTTLLKDLVGRVRPDYAQGGARLDTLSFPSGHSSGIATLVVVGLLLAWPLLSPRAQRWWVLAGVVLALVVGLSRIWLGVHYPSDVIGGWSFGIAWTLLTAQVFGVLPGGRAALRPAR